MVFMMASQFFDEKISVKKLLSRFRYAALMVPLSLFPGQAKAMITIIVSATVDINFGSVTETGAGGTVTVDTAGARTVGGSVTAITGAGLESNGVISISGSTGLPIDLSITPATFTVSDGANTMSVNAFDLDTGAGVTDAITVTLTANPSTFPIGATLNVGAGQAAGTYSGTYVVNATYQ